MSNSFTSATPATSIGYLRRYLAAYGWKRKSLKRSDLELFVLASGDRQELKIVLPTDNHDPDIARRVEFALRTLAGVEDRDTNQISESVQLIATDLLKASLPDHMVWHGSSIKLRVAENFLRTSRRLLTAAAAMEIEPNPFQVALPSESEEYAHRCRLGHTFEGSFGFRIESPVGPHPDRSLPDEDIHPPPFERMVMKRLIRGFRTIAKASATGEPEAISRNFGFGFNADMCDELVRMIESTDANIISFGFELSPEWKTTDDVSKSEQIKISSEAVGVIKFAASSLRVQKPNRRQRIQGRVVRLSTRENPADLFSSSGSREIAVSWESEELGDISVTLRLPPQEYREAVDAHTSFRQIAVSGILDRLGRRWVLNDLADFEVLPTDKDKHA
ncbi:hypothetical protein BHAOGJBA_0170 [Methylobacterium hispanicum]|uniref:Uncharacterized protein n=1 Tax=Methylobacterium hispanicum TaxID=270350 RepID=A0AAV4ZDV7_9HYPH|nr:MULTISPECIES: hypothetical protein [Methylobacterium]GJD86675.1 hypothetical protein BHAOGJBA_0170 [Methylobacterium hispanicum]